MKRAFLITHTETAMDKQGRVHGHLDPPLSSSGRVKAKQIAKSMRNKGIKRIHSSPLARARELAAMLAKETGAPVIVALQLTPWDLGNMSGAKLSAIKPVMDFFSARPNRPIPGGESKGTFLGRYKDFARKIEPGDAVVAHSQHNLTWDYVQNGGDASKVPMTGTKPGTVKELKI
jgi:broad specificity phosphatase PhoE